jgi:hypothetical protein
MTDKEKAIEKGIEPKPHTPEVEGELRDEDIETISGGGKNANNGEGYTTT